MKKVKKISKVCMLLVCIVSLVCISFATTASAASYEPAAKVNFFGADQTNLSSGGSTVIRWNVANAYKIDIKGIEKEQENADELNPQNGSLDVWPEKTTTYILTAYGKGGDASATVTVNIDVAKTVKIDYFTASATTIEPGNSVKLKLGTTNAKSVEIIGLEKVIECDKADEVEVWPEVTTTYVLFAYGAKGDVDSKSITVNVVDKPQVSDASINYFNASSSEIYAGQNVNLTWEATNAKSVAIKNVQSGLAAKGTLNVAPTATTTYTLEVTGFNSKVVTKTVTVTVKQAPTKPVIKYFNASKTTISKGTMVTLSWETTNTTGCMILTSDGAKLTNKASTGKISVTPNTTRTYTLVGYNASNEKVQQSITITVK